MPEQLLLDYVLVSVEKLCNFVMSTLCQTQLLQDAGLRYFVAGPTNCPINIDKISRSRRSFATVDSRITPADELS
jgi:hypothetical protein